MRLAFVALLLLVSDHMKSVDTSKFSNFNCSCLLDKFIPLCGVFFPQLCNAKQMNSPCIVIYHSYYLLSSYHEIRLWVFEAEIREF